jgi:hypothetical protein
VILLERRRCLADICESSGIPSLGMLGPPHQRNRRNGLPLFAERAQSPQFAAHEDVGGQGRDRRDTRMGHEQQPTAQRWTKACIAKAPEEE